MLAVKTSIQVKTAIRMQEVRIIGNNFTAECGRAQGVVVFTTKSGTNDYHGTGFYGIRDEALNANGFANNTYDGRQLELAAKFKF